LTTRFAGAYHGSGESRCFNYIPGILVVVSSDGKFIYAANRLHDSIAFFSVTAGGEVTYAGEEWTRGDYPRSFTIDPTGQFLYCCNQRSDAITTFRVHRDAGRLEFTGRYTPVGTPSMIVFLP
jgi:6-phosphogluconolactonase